ncbi:hypothetical protein [Paractinoplanes toevensis]|uniref:Uncharacterized protein n=1 Tax=Paractinoplanes toevensis TaxID=571911 RepID=A0A919WDB2_9ACTN|nr:hypothetical protein [Actinoplanes toevensis]GIM98061.1 hypothetical protein Ato02nite_098540 [Actinoplanes toevensis]
MNNSTARPNPYTLLVTYLANLVDAYQRARRPLLLGLRHQSTDIAEAIVSHAFAIVIISLSPLHTLL